METHIEFGGDEHRRAGDQLHLVHDDDLLAEEEVDEFDAEVERLVVELEGFLDFDHPIDERCSVLLRDVRLTNHVVVHLEALLKLADCCPQNK